MIFMPTSQHYFTNLNTVHNTLLGGQLLFMVVAYFLVPEQEPDAATEKLVSIFTVAVPVLIFFGVLLSIVLMKGKLRTILPSATLGEKLAQYRAALLIRYALLLFPALLALVAYFITAGSMFLGLAGIMALIFFINRPTKERTIEDLELKPAETALLNRPDAEIA